MGTSRKPASVHLLNGLCSVPIPWLGGPQMPGIWHEIEASIYRQRTQKLSKLSIIPVPCCHPPQNKDCMASSSPSSGPVSFTLWSHLGRLNGHCVHRATDCGHPRILDGYFSATVVTGVIRVRGWTLEAPISWAWPPILKMPMDDK